ncbi:MAG: urease accessory protein UreH, partial [Candidatus Latescibacteria bacterium]|nr:urease accessory protein UreH [Candidatus Latescibacterota bacterium]NIM65489.1 urease accessory protein UreH [Candidatus Latescibacterota bacterium]NIO01869.1 urease accessory protein UreH [Candidatus Latescibacterota bacterium]NIT02037.1 urease accessory protein UreH [Candidatus Latescibacterota bacterium]NIT38793.1 urease accessory protein UreH [Candidatus Latescibacterota bacterium]
GVKHALDADHLIAVSTIVAEYKSLKWASLIGAFWGLGHTLTLFFVGLLVIGLRLTIPYRVALGLEFLVAVMLVVLGLSILWRS